MVILMHMCNVASVEVFNKALLTYLLTGEPSLSCARPTADG